MYNQIIKLKNLKNRIKFQKRNLKHLRQVKLDQSKNLSIPNIILKYFTISYFFY